MFIKIHFYNLLHIYFPVLDKKTVPTQNVLENRLCYYIKCTYKLQL